MSTDLEREPVLRVSSLRKHYGQVEAGQGFNAGMLGVSVVMAILYILLAYWLFARVFRYAVRTGLLARNSAESAS